LWIEWFAETSNNALKKSSAGHRMYYSFMNKNGGKGESYNATI